MKRRLVIFLSLGLLLLIGWAVIRIINLSEEKKANEETLQSLDATCNSLGVKLPGHKPYTLLVYFNSECEHCQWELKQLDANLNALNECNLALFSHEPQEQADNYLKTSPLGPFYKHAPIENVMNTFKGGVPQLYIYHNGQLVKHFKGEVKIDAILAVLDK